MSVYGLSRGIEGGIFMIGMQLEADMQARRAQRRIDNDFAAFGTRWSNYARRLLQALKASQHREQQLRADLADALAVIEKLERRH